MPPCPVDTVLGEGGTRDLVHAEQALCQLSLGGKQNSMSPDQVGSFDINHWSGWEVTSWEQFNE